MQHQIVSQEQWLKARTALLDHEKALTRHRDAVAAFAGDCPACGE
jgi:predicted dithiol-disulfide oxidoreductase (DUF899 family)